MVRRNGNPSLRAMVVALLVFERAMSYEYIPTVADSDLCTLSIRVSASARDL